MRRRAWTSGLLAVTAAGPVLAAQPLEAPAPAPAGVRPDRLGELVLPASGLRVMAPRADRERVEVFGRYGVPAAGGLPELSDALAIRMEPGVPGVPPDGLAISVATGAGDCEAFRALEGVLRGVSACDRALPEGFKADRRCAAVTRWDRLDQSDVGEGLAGSVWCGSGLLVHVVRPTEPGPEPDATRRLASWLDALADATQRAPAAMTPPERVLLEAERPSDETRTLPVTQSFYLLAARREVTTKHPVVRVDTLPDGRPCSASPDARFDGDDPLDAPSEPPGFPGAIAAADCFALVAPAALAQHGRVTARAETCPPPMARPEGWPKGRAWPPLADEGEPEGATLAPTSWSPALVEVCLPLDAGHSLRVALRPDPAAFRGGPVPSGAAAQASREAALPILRFEAARPFLRELGHATR